jgi:hypothetical protein
MFNRFAVIAALVASSTLGAQGIQLGDSAGKPRWELLMPSGKLLPTGDQRDAITRGDLSALQVTYVVRPMIAVTSMFGWGRARDNAATGAPKVDVFTYDIGAELRGPRLMAGKAVSFSPFTGFGAGGRSYNYRKLDVAATHNVSAYASAGGELGFRRVRVRLEARDYVSGFKPLSGAGEARTGNDVVVMGGLRIVAR